VTNPATRATLEVLPADAPGAWGRRPHLLIADERAQWPDTDDYLKGRLKLWRALFSALGQDGGGEAGRADERGRPEP
jgi:hypothetical protein